MIREDEIHAIQMDLFDNRRKNTSNTKSPVMLRLRIETPKTNGDWFHATANMLPDRKPSQTRRTITNEMDAEIFNTLVAHREDLQVRNVKGWDYKPVISTFHEKGSRKSGSIPTFFAMAYKVKGDDWQVIINVGQFCKQYQLEDKQSETHDIYFASERFVYQDLEKVRARYGF